MNVHNIQHHPDTSVTCLPPLLPRHLDSHLPFWEVIKRISVVSLSLSPHIKLIPEHLDKYLLLTYYLYTYVLIIYCSCSYISEFHLIKWKNCTQCTSTFGMYFLKLSTITLDRQKKCVSKYIVQYNTIAMHF